MDLNKKIMLEKISDCVVDMEDEEISDLCVEYIENGFSAYDGIMDGLVDGMNRAAKLYDEEEYYIAELLLCSDAMYKGIEVLKKHLPEDFSIEDDKRVAIMGVVEGDTHDIGKNLVKIMFETAGYKVVDLGKDVLLDRFIESAISEDADLICMSSLMSTTMYGMKEVIDRLNERGIRHRFKVMVGGGTITEEFAKKIGADAYSKNAVEAVKVANSLFT